MLPKTVIVAFTQNAFSAERGLAQTYRAMGWQEYVRTPSCDTDPLLALAAFVCHFCLDEDGVYNNFSHPLTNIAAPFLEHYQLRLDTGRVLELRALLDSGEADVPLVADMLRDLTH